MQHSEEEEQPQQEEPMTLTSLMKVHGERLDHMSREMENILALPVPGTGSRLNERFVHVEKHEYVKSYCQSLLSKWRYRVEPMWAIEVIVRCPSEMGAHEATIWWDEECWYACIEIMCAHLEDMLEWLIVHELCELRRWRSTGHMMEMLGLLVDGADKERLVRGFHIARNQEIEMEVYELLGRRRPFHVRMGEEEGGGER